MNAPNRNTTTKSAGSPGSGGQVIREALDTGADVTVGDSGWHVRLHRSPLAEILRICGHGDRTTAVPWLDGLPVRVVIAP